MISRMMTTVRSQDETKVSSEIVEDNIDDVVLDSNNEPLSSSTQQEQDPLHREEENVPSDSVGEAEEVSELATEAEDYDDEQQPQRVFLPESIESYNVALNDEATTTRMILQLHITITILVTKMHNQR